MKRACRDPAQNGKAMAQKPNGFNLANSAARQKGISFVLVEVNPAWPNLVIPGPADPECRFPRSTPCAEPRVRRGYADVAMESQTRLRLAPP